MKEYGDSSKIKHRIMIWSNNSTSGYAPKRILIRDSSKYLCNHVHSSITHTGEKLEATQMPADRRMNKQNVVDTYKGPPWWPRRYSICLQCRRPGFSPWVRKILWRRKWHPTPVLLPGKSHERRSVVGYSPCVFYSYNRMLFSFKKEGNSNTCYNTDELWGS